MHIWLSIDYYLQSCMYFNRRCLQSSTRRLSTVVYVLWQTKSTTVFLLHDTHIHSNIILEFLIPYMKLIWKRHSRTGGSKKISNWHGIFLIYCTFYVLAVTHIVPNMSMLQSASNPLYRPTYFNKMSNMTLKSNTLNGPNNL